MMLGSSDFEEINAAFAKLAQRRADALLVRTNNLFMDRVVQIATLAARHAVPTIHFQRQFPAVGELMSYGPNYLEQLRQVGVYIGRILKGEKPAELITLLGCAAAWPLAVRAQQAVPTLLTDLPVPERRDKMGKPPRPYY
jgi:ABC-type uncharacterized transport system substrate-binding protein